jgi:hypothetical protein
VDGGTGQARTLGLSDESRVPWPQSDAVGGDLLGIEIPVHVLPRSVLVQAFGALHEDGTPQGSPYFDLECFIHQFVNKDPPCALVETPGGFVLPLTNLQIRTRVVHISVNASWVLPQEKSKDGGPDWGTWLFSGRAEIDDG